MQAAMQTELNKFVGALGEFYAREAFLFEKGLGVVRLLDRGLSGVGKDQRGLGCLHRRRHRSGFIELVGRADQGCRIGRGVSRRYHRRREG
jgi:hypothetical protein